MAIVASKEFFINPSIEIIDLVDVSKVPSNNTARANATIYAAKYGEYSGVSTDAVPMKSNALYRASTSFVKKSGVYEYYNLRLYEDIVYPPSFTSIPSEAKAGESITITWSSVSSATRYELERQVNGGTWSRIYSGSNRTYTDTISENWNTVSYRIRVYHADKYYNGTTRDVYSNYKTSSIITIKSFPQLKIKVNDTLKTSEKGWVKVNGQLREIDTIWVKINGQLREVE